MKKSEVWLKRVKTNTPNEVGQAAVQVLKQLVDENGIDLAPELMIKVHTGQPGNVTFITPPYFDSLIDYLESKHVSPQFVETNTAGGVRSRKKEHLEVARTHGFIRLPVVIADGNEGFDHVEVPITGGKEFTKAMIASKLATEDQVLVASHFKGHCMTGFGGALKMLGIGFASGRAKAMMHSSVELPEKESVNWGKAKIDDGKGGWRWNGQVVHFGTKFNRRVAEYAQAAVRGKKHVYVSFLINITDNCDCDGQEMECIYPHIGVLASLDPVAIDKACFDLVAQASGKKKPFEGEEMFAFAQELNIGQATYHLVEM